MPDPSGVTGGAWTRTGVEGHWTRAYGVPEGERSAGDLAMLARGRENRMR
jgi:hypothetical protein